VCQSQHPTRRLSLSKPEPVTEICPSTSSGHAGYPQAERLRRFFSGVSQPEPVFYGVSKCIFSLFVPFDRLRARSLLQAELVEAYLQDNTKLDQFLSILYTGSK